MSRSSVFYVNDFRCWLTVTNILFIFPSNTSWQENLKSSKFWQLPVKTGSDEHTHKHLYILSPQKVSRVNILSLVRIWEIYVSNCGHRISRPEVNFIKLFHITLDLISVYNIYKFQVNHLKNKRDLWYRKSRKWNFFRQLPEVDESVSGRHNIFWYYKRDLINWYRFSFKIKILKISISTITSCDDRKWRPTRSTPLCTSTK